MRVLHPIIAIASSPSALESRKNDYFIIFQIAIIIICSKGGLNRFELELNAVQNRTRFRMGSSLSSGLWLET